MTAAVRAGSISVQDARRLRGRFVFARAQAFGRCGAPAMRMLGVIAEARRPQPHEMAAAIDALPRLLVLVGQSPPRAAARVPSPLVLFVDGACEPGLDGSGLPRVGVWACLFEGGADRVDYFGADLGMGSPLNAAWRTGRAHA